MSTLWKDLCTFTMVSSCKPFQLKNVSDKNCRENQNTHPMFFRKSCHLWDNVENTVESDRPQMTISYGTCTLHDGLLHRYANKHCITVLTKSFYWCVSPYVYCSSRVYVMQGKGNSSTNSVRTRLLWNRSGLWYVVKNLRRPAIVGPISWQWIVCTLLETLRCIMQTLDQAVSGARCPKIIWRVRQQQ